MNIIKNRVLSAGPSGLATLLAVAISTLCATAWAQSPSLRERGQGGQIAANVIPAKVLRYAERTIGRHDLDHDGRLTAQEWQAMQGRPAEADLDGDGRITLAEFARHVADFGWQRSLRPVRRFTVALDDLLPLLRPTTEADPASLAPDGRSNRAEFPHASAPGIAPNAAPGETTDGSTDSLTGGPATPTGQSPTTTAYDPRLERRYSARLPKGLPSWFDERDANGDGQLTLAEFSPRSSAAEEGRFTKLDLNRDGLLTAREYLRATKSPR